MGGRSLVGAKWGAIVGRHQATWSLFERSVSSAFTRGIQGHNQTLRPTHQKSRSHRGGQGVQIPSAPPSSCRSGGLFRSLALDVGAEPGIPGMAELRQYGGAGYLRPIPRLWARKPSTAISRFSLIGAPAHRRRGRPPPEGLDGHLGVDLRQGRRAGSAKSPIVFSEKPPSAAGAACKVCRLGRRPRHHRT